MMCGSYLYSECRSHSEAGNPVESESDYGAFHIAWLRIGPDKEWPEFSNWKSRSLHGTHGQGSFGRGGI